MQSPSSVDIPVESRLLHEEILTGAYWLRDHAAEFAAHVANGDAEGLAHALTAQGLSVRGADAVLDQPLRRVMQIVTSEASE